MPDATICPDPTCQAPAVIVERWRVGSTLGAVEQVKTRCERGHWFTPLADSLDLHKAPAAQRARVAAT